MANYGAMCLALTIPAVLLGVSLLFPTLKGKIIGITLAFFPSVLMCFVGLLLAEIVVDVIRTGKDPTFIQLQTVSAGETRVIAYRTDGGATTDFGLAVRQEMTIIPGVLLVRRLLEEYHARDASLEVEGPDRIKVIVGPRGHITTTREFEVAVKPHVYW